MKDAKRDTKNIFYLRKNRFNPLGRIKPIRTVLQIFRTTTFSPNICTLARLQSQSISSSRPFSGTYVFSCNRHRKNREFTIADSQWAYTTASGITRVPSPGYITHFSLAFRQIAPQQFTNSTRQSKETPLLFTWTAIQCNNRHRHNCSDDLWASRGSCSWIYSQATTWQTLICPDNFQRRPYWTIAWSGTTERRRSRYNRSMAFSRKHPGQIAFNNRNQQNTGSAGWSILRQRHNKEARRQREPLCHCCQDDATIEKSNAFRQISRICRRLGSSRICLFPVQLEPASPFRCNPQASQIRVGRYSTETLHNRPLYLSQSFGRGQSRSYTRIGVSFLLRQGISRTLTAGIQKRSEHGQNSNTELLGEFRLYGNDSLGIRFGSCVSVSLFAERIPALEYFYASQGTLVVASRMRKTWEQQYSSVTS